MIFSLLMIKRIVLFLLTNIAVIAVVSVLLSLFHIGSYITPYGIDVRALLIFATLFGFVGSFISLFLSKWMAKRAYGVRIITSPQNTEEAFLIQTVQILAERAGIAMPEVGVYMSPEVNAFATGWNKNNALVAVSEGLLEHMEKNEAEGVLGHEISHIANGDMVTMALLQGVVNTFVIFFARIAAYIVQSFVNRGNEDEGNVGGFVYYAVSFLFEILFGVLASIIVMWFSRYREYRADAGSAHLWGNPQKMIFALKRLEALEGKLPVDERSSALKTMKINDKSALFSLFSSHPSIKERIDALQKGSI